MANIANIIVAGACGRMGQTILRLALADSSIKVAGAFERSDHSSIGRDIGEILGQDSVKVPVHPDFRECVGVGNVVIDFTHPAATAQNLKVAVQKKIGMVIGTTGLSNAFIRELKRVSKKIPIVQSPNMSLGVNLLFRLTNMTAELLDDSYDIEIVEAHHRHKKDAPSGTALELVRQAAFGRKINLESNVTFGRKGDTGARKAGAIGVHAIRGGDVVGDHQVAFMTDGERIELVHKASSRDAFAKGALLAAKFVAKKKNGFYNMQQVLGL